MWADSFYNTTSIGEAISLAGALAVQDEVSYVVLEQPNAGETDWTYHVTTSNRWETMPHDHYILRLTITPEKDTI